MLEVLLSNVITTALILSVLVIPLVEVFKRAGLAKRWTPAFSVIVGIFVSWIASNHVAIDSVVLSGAVSGFIACGLWSGVKTTIGK